MISHLPTTVPTAAVVAPLVLRVSNPAMLESGSTANFVAVGQSVTIGSAVGVDWRLCDSAGSVGGAHAALQLIEGRHVLIDLCGRTYINPPDDNDNYAPLGKMGVVSLNDGDEIIVGKYHIAVLVDYSNEAAKLGLNHIRQLDLNGYLGIDNSLEMLTAPVALEHGSDKVVLEEVNALNELLITPADPDALNELLQAVENEETIARRHELFQGDKKRGLTEEFISIDLTGTTREGLRLPMGISSKRNTDAKKTQSSDDFIDAKSSVIHQVETQKPHLQKTHKGNLDVIADSPVEPFSAPSYEQRVPSDALTSTQEISPMNQTILDVQEKKATTAADEVAAYSASKQQFDVDHIAVAPLIKAMGLSVVDMDSAQARRFLVDAGATLRATMEGLLALYQAEQHGPVNLSLLGRSYHPIEDNALRMGMDYDATAKNLFTAQRNRVHLSPAAAVAETMSSIKDNQAALINAVQQGLWQVLEAFSPERLQKRFDAYDSYGDSDRNDGDQAWDMYCDYFKELKSSRQSGLEKMFWEVFEQNYDRAMRSDRTEDLS